MKAETLSKKIWFDGKVMDLADARIPLLTHSLFYGSGVFEGIRCYFTPKGPAVFRLKDHIHHLFHSAKIMGMTIPYSENDIMIAIINLIKQNTRHYAKRQMTWFKKDSRIIWLESKNNPLKNILNYLKKSDII